MGDTEMLIATTNFLATNASTIARDLICT